MCARVEDFLQGDYRFVDNSRPSSSSSIIVLVWGEVYYFLRYISILYLLFIFVEIIMIYIIIIIIIFILLLLLLYVTFIIN